MTSENGAGFGEIGFLAQEIGGWGSAHVRNFAPQYSVSLSINRFFQKWLFGLEIQEFNAKGELDPQPLMIACLAARALSHCQAVLILTQRGMISEARIITRSLLEATFRAAAIAQHPEIAREYILEDNPLRQNLIKRFGRLSPAGRSGITEAEREAARAAIDSALDEYGGEAHTTLWYAQKGGLEDFYHSAYALLSITVHVQARDLQQYVEADASGKITSLIFKPTDDGASTILMATQECLLLILEQAQIVFPSEGIAERTKQLREEFVAVTKPLAQRG